LLVPEQFSFESEREMLRIIGSANINKIQITSFTRLASRTLNENTTSNLDEIDEAAKAALLSYSMIQIRDELCYFPKKIFDAETIADLIRIDAKMKLAGITTADLLSIASKEKPESAFYKKCTDVSLILDLYNGLIENRFIDKSTVLSRLAEYLESSDDFSDYTICIDGFRHFSHAEYLIIEQLCIKAKDVYFSICSRSAYGADNPDNVFAHPIKIMNRIRDIAKKHKLEIDTDYKILDNSGRYNSSELQLLESYIFAKEKEEHESTPKDITINYAPSIIKECEIVAHECKRLVRECGIRARDITIIERNEKEYDSLLVAALKKVNLPVFEDKRHSVIDEPLIRMVLAAVKAASHNFTGDELCRYAKCQLSPYSLEDICELDNYALIWEIKDKDWLEDWTENPDGLGRSFNEKSAEKLERINATRKALVEPIRKLQYRLDEGEPYEQVTAVYDFLIETKADEQLRIHCDNLYKEGFEEEAIDCANTWDLLMNVLSNILVIIDERVNPNDFYSLLNTYLSSFSIGEIPQGLDEIRIGNADRILIGSPKIVFAVGVCQGNYPKVKENKGIFSDKEMWKFADAYPDFADSPEAAALEERFIMYSVITAPTDKLYLSYSATSDNEEKIPSVIFSEVRALFPNIQTNYPTNDVISNIESLSDAYAMYAKLMRVKNKDFYLLDKYFSQKPEFDDKIKRLKKLSSCSPIEFENKNNAVALFGKNMKVSATKVEDYHHCQFYYFLRHGLNIKERKIQTIDERVEGLIFHYVLENIITEYSTKALSAFSKTKIRKIVKDKVEKYIQSDLGNMSNRMNFIVNSYCRTIEILLERMLDELQNSSFEPVCTELEIGKDINAYEIMLDDNGKVEIVGKVDRVDKMIGQNNDFVRVIDYKTGSVDFDLNDCLYGTRLQMLLYLKSICNSISKFSGLPAGVLYFPARIGSGNLNRNASEDEIENQSILNGKLGGFVIDTPEVLEGIDSTKRYIWLNVKIDKNGKLFGNGLISLETLNLLHNKIDQIINEMGINLHEGKVPISPLTDSEKETPYKCRYCGFSSICLNNYDSPRVKKKRKQSEVISFLKGEDEDGNLYADTGTTESD